MIKDKYVLLVVGLIVLGIIVLEVKRAVHETPVTDSNSVTEDRYAGLTSQGLLEKMKNGDSFVLVDLRLPSEYTGGHIRGAINIPIGNIENGYNELNKDSDIILYCKSGPWSRQAYKILQSRGYKNIKVLVNGIVGWKWEVNGEVIPLPEIAGK